MEAMVDVGSPPPRIEIGAPLKSSKGGRWNHHLISSRIRDGSCRRTHYDTLRDLPDCCHAPERDEELAGERHDHLLAQAWSAVDACLKPERQRALLLKQQPAPGELDHAATDAGVAGFGEALLAPPRAALVGR